MDRPWPSRRPRRARGLSGTAPRRPRGPGPLSASATADARLTAAHVATNPAPRTSVPSIEVSASRSRLRRLQAAPARRTPRARRAWGRTTGEVVRDLVPESHRRCSEARSSAGAAAGHAMHRVSAPAEPWSATAATANTASANASAMSGPRGGLRPGESWVLVWRSDLVTGASPATGARSERRESEEPPSGAPRQKMSRGTRRAGQPRASCARPTSARPVPARGRDPPGRRAVRGDRASRPPSTGAGVVKDAEAILGSRSRPSWTATTRPRERMNIVAPTDQMSLCGPTRSHRPRACSWRHEPRACPWGRPTASCETRALPWSSIRAMPKSSTLTHPSEVRKRFSGLDVAVNDALVVRGPQDVEDPVGDEQHARGIRDARPCASAISMERGAVEELHHEKRARPSVVTSSSSTRTAPGWFTRFAM